MEIDAMEILDFDVSFGNWVLQHFTRGAKQMFREVCFNFLSESGLHSHIEYPQQLRFRLRIAHLPSTREICFDAINELQRRDFLPFVNNLTFPLVSIVGIVSRYFAISEKIRSRVFTCDYCSWTTISFCDVPDECAECHRGIRENQKQRDVVQRRAIVLSDHDTVPSTSTRNSIMVRLDEDLIDAVQIGDKISVIGVPWLSLSRKRSIHSTMVQSSPSIRWKDVSPQIHQSQCSSESLHSSLDPRNDESPTVLCRFPPMGLHSTPHR
eukprot:TRINITY_DN11263_c0_g1_i1.p1 TRINITY_DN11263_c0_g1~~TRINITY_DN11263_c0_g1_i1.p1  ORF type:complete len:305 (-),score=45.07 TRINITY_DN11263_c0_g1_i1:174-974(-)